MNPRLFSIVIDDDPSVCRALHRLLRAAGMDVETYASAAGFLGRALPGEPDCLVLDIHMPGMTGPALRDRLREEGRRIPIVFITGHSADENGDVGDGTRVLRKPFGAQALLDAIHLAVREVRDRLPGPQEA